jgi:hypothetical protein
MNLLEKKMIFYILAILEQFIKKSNYLFFVCDCGSKSKTIETGTVNGHDNPIYRILTQITLKLIQSQ